MKPCIALSVFAAFFTVATHAAPKWIETQGAQSYALHVPAVKIPVITLLDGREFKDCVVAKETYASISFRHAKGMTKVEKRLLPPDVLALFPLDEEKEKSELEANAAGQKIHEARKAEVAAQRETAERVRLVRLEELKAKALAEADARRERSKVAVADAVDQIQTKQAINQATGAGIEPAIRTRAENYYKDGRRNGSSATLVFDLRIEMGPVTPVPGWPDRYSCEGRVFYNIYDSIWGGSFTSRDSRFSCEVRQNSGYVEVLDFTPRS